MVGPLEAGCPLHAPRPPPQSRFYAIALLSLGGGIGATTTIFSVVDAVDFRPLPFPNASRLVWMAELPPAEAGGCPSCPASSAPATASYWAAQSRTIDEIAALAGYDLPWQHDDVIEYILGMRVTPNLLPMLGVQPERGQAFSESRAQGPEYAGNVRVPLLRQDRRFLICHAKGRKNDFGLCLTIAPVHAAFELHAHALAGGSQTALYLLAVVHVVALGLFPT